MNAVKRTLLEVCVWLGGDDPRREALSSDHAWLVPGHWLLNGLIAWAHTASPAADTPRVGRASEYPTI